MFMQPFLSEESAYHVETTGGTFIVPTDLVGDAPSLEDFRDYVEGTPESFERRDGWLYYFSAPGYLDRTDYGHATTMAEAVDALLEDADDEQTDAILASVGLDLDVFLESYVETALWSSHDIGEDGTMGAPLDDEYGPDDLAPDARESATADCRAFLASNWETIHRLIAERDYTVGHAGHDFWLTRNRHGAGFWDRGFGPDGEALTKDAHAYGSVVLHAHEGKVHGS